MIIPDFIAGVTFTLWITCVILSTKKMSEITKIRKER